MERKNENHTEDQRPLTQRAGITGLANGVRKIERMEISGESRRRMSKINSPINST